MPPSPAWGLARQEWCGFATQPRRSAPRANERRADNDKTYALAPLGLTTRSPRLCGTGGRPLAHMLGKFESIQWSGGYSRARRVC